MARWEPDARGRMMDAAIELYAERGFEGTTVSEIAERAGVTERTFFRHFADKREVLFSGGEILASVLEDGIAAAPADVAPLDAVMLALAEFDKFFIDPAHSSQRQAIIDANPSLQERELIKMASLSATIGRALRARGVPEPTASVTAAAGIVVFHMAFNRWVAAGGKTAYGDFVREAREELRAVTA